MLKVKLITADVIEGLSTLPLNSVHCAVTSPPYWQLRDYEVEGQLGQEGTLQEFLDNQVRVFDALKPVLHKTGTLWVNMGDSYNSNKRKGSFGDQSKRGYEEHGSDRVTVDWLNPKDLVGQPWRLAFALQENGWILRDVVIWHKCLAASTRVYAKTQKGEMPMTIHDLIKLDSETVQLWTGTKWSKIIEWNKTFCESPMRITLRSGETIISSPEHRWPISNDQIVETKNLKVGDSLKQTVLPEPEEKFGTQIDLDLAWFAGLYLAEGSMSGNAIQIAGNIKEDERHSKLEDLCERYGGHLALHEHGENGVNAVIHGQFFHAAISHFLSGNTCYKKHLHPRTWKHRNEILWSILDGYLSGDGHNDMHNSRWRLGFGKNEMLANDLRTLSARLDLILTLNPSFSYIGKKKFESYRGEIRAGKSHHHNCKDRNEIVKIENIRSSNLYDIAIEDEPHLFALASGVLTHNSNSMPASMEDRTTPAHEYFFMFAKKPRYFYDFRAISEEYEDSDESGNPVMLLKRKRSVWTIPTEQSKYEHYAAFPKKLVEPAILAGTSEKGCCSKCLHPLNRVVEPIGNSNHGGLRKRADAPGAETSKTSVFRTGKITLYETVGWERKCACIESEVIPCTVLDPYSGTGTTGVVANCAGRNYIGIDINPLSNKMAFENIQDSSTNLLFTDFEVIK